MKLLVCDMGGTLIKYNNSKSSWSKLNNIMVVTEKNKKLQKKFKNSKNYSYLDFSHDTVSLYLKDNINKQDIEKLKQETIYKKGIEELINHCKGQNMKIVIITGGIGNIANMIKEEYNIDKVFATCNFKFDGNELVKYSLEKCGSKREKLKILNKYLEENNLTYEDTVFIGDGENDKKIFSKIEKSFNISDNSFDESYTVEDLEEIKLKLKTSKNL